MTGNPRRVEPQDERCQLAPDPMRRRPVTEQHQLDLFAGPATFSDVVEAYLAQKADVRPQTIAEYQSVTRRVWRARPDIADLDVAEVDIAHMLEIRDLLLPTPGVHRPARSAMAQALDYAARLGLRADTNPARGRVAAGYKHRSKRPSKELIDEFIPSIKAVESRGEIPPIAADFFELAVLSGFRHTELIRLRVGDVDLERLTIIIKMKSRGTRVSIDEEMPVAPRAAAILARRIEQSRNGWLFPAPQRASHWRPAYVWEQWPPILLELEDRGVDVLDRVIGTKIVPTVTRSIAARIRTRAGISLIVAQGSMGHRRLQTTMSYCPSMEVEIRDAMQIVENTLDPAPDPAPESSDRCMALARRILERRKALKLSRGEVVTRYAATTGKVVTRQGWMYWEKNGCGLKQIDAVADVLQTTVDDLLGFSSEVR